MNKTILSLFILFFSFSLAQENEAILGKWNGSLNVQGMKLPLILKINSNEGELDASLDSPSQNAYGIPITYISFVEDSLHFKVEAANISYKGLLKEKEIEGTFKQGMFSTELKLTRNKEKTEVEKKVQEPSKPYPYDEEEVVFENKVENFKLAGTLTTPRGEGPFPAIIMISGSGAQDRNSEILGHKPFLVVADYLTRKGMAVLRYDDRGTAASEGDFEEATSEDFKQDAIAAIEYLKTRPEIDTTKIGVFGHSEGGMIAPMISSHPDVNFLVLIAPPVAPIDQLLLLQQELIGELSGMSPSELTLNRNINKSLYELIKNTEDEELPKMFTAFWKETLEAYPQLAKSQGLSEEVFISYQEEAYLNPWMLYFLRFDPKQNLHDTKIPVLGLFGEKDMQVSAKQNEPLLKEYIAKNNASNRIKTLKDLNHLMQLAETGSPSEYAENKDTFSEKALKEILTWLQDIKVLRK